MTRWDGYSKNCSLHKGKSYQPNARDLLAWNPKFYWFDTDWILVIIKGSCTQRLEVCPKIYIYNFWFRVISASSATVCKLSDFVLMSSLVTNVIIKQSWSFCNRMWHTGFGMKISWFSMVHCDALFNCFDLNIPKCRCELCLNIN